MSLTVFRIFHAGYIVENSNTRIVFDPILENPFSYNCYAFPDVNIDIEKFKSQKFDAIFISHYHDDHFSLESLKYFNRHTPVYIYTHFLAHIELLIKLGFTQVIQLKVNDLIDLNSIQVKVLESLEPEVDSLFHICFENINIVNVVDSWLSVNALNYLKQLPIIDLLLWPFQYMREVEVLSPVRYSHDAPLLITEHLEQLQQLNVKTIVPSSCQFRFEEWSWYNQFFFQISYSQFISAMQKMNIKAFRLEPGTSIEIYNSEIKANSKLLDFISCNNSQLVDYEFNNQVHIKELEEYSQYFRKLSDLENMKLTEFLDNLLIKKLNEVKLHAYFNVETTNQYFWNLVVIQKHIRVNYCYLFHENKVVRIAENQTNNMSLFWQTEIIDVKLINALEGLETLTSLYVRVNNRFFDKSIEDRMLEYDVHVLNDPLLSILFNHKNVDHYQREQLKKINL